MLNNIAFNYKLFDSQVDGYHKNSFIVQLWFTIRFNLIINLSLSSVAGLVMLTSANRFAWVICILTDFAIELIWYFLPNWNRYIRSNADTNGVLNCMVWKTMPSIYTTNNKVKVLSNVFGESNNELACYFYFLLWLFDCHWIFSVVAFGIRIYFHITTKTTKENY